MPFFADMTPSNFDAATTAVAILHRTETSHTVVCSGVPLSSKIVLTAAHCLPTASKEQGQMKDTSALAILRQGVDPEDYSRVLSWIVHPQFKAAPRPKHEDFDLALIETESDTPWVQNTPTFKTNLLTAAIPSQSVLWISGFSPTRLGLLSPKEIIRSPHVWADVQMLRQYPTEGKFLATSRRRHKAAACPGDSGAPVWRFEHGQARLEGLVVQGNCEKGEVKIVDIRRYATWIREAARRLNAASPIR